MKSPIFATIFLGPFGFLGVDEGLEGRECNLVGRKFRTVVGEEFFGDFVAGLSGAEGTLDSVVGTPWGGGPVCDDVGTLRGMLFLVAAGDRRTCEVLETRKIDDMLITVYDTVEIRRECIVALTIVYFVNDRRHIDKV